MTVPDRQQPPQPQLVAILAWWLVTHGYNDPHGDARLALACMSLPRPGDLLSVRTT